jgi:hypothetical protein
VDISVRPTSFGAGVEIVDHGVGMTPARLAEENARLVRRERLDLAPTRVLGLFVVGRLARRCGIAVRLAATHGGGVTVRLDIGAGLLFNASEPPARRHGPAQASRAVRPGAQGPALPEQRVTRAEAPVAPPRPVVPPARPATPQAKPTPAASPAADDATATRDFSPLPHRHSAPNQPRQPAAPATANGHALPGQAPAEETGGIPRRANGTGINGSAPARSALPLPEPEFTSAELARRLRAAALAAEAEAEAPPKALEQDPNAAPLPRRRTEPEPEPPAEPLAPVSAPASAPQQPDLAGESAPAVLPRRSRGRSALREPAPSVASILADAHLLDAEAARAAVEEFEAGVEEAMRVSAQNLPMLRASDESEGIRP